METKDQSTVNVVLETTSNTSAFSQQDIANGNGLLKSLFSTLSDSERGNLNHQITNNMIKNKKGKEKLPESEWSTEGLEETEQQNTNDISLVSNPSSSSSNVNRLTLEDLQNQINERSDEINARLNNPVNSDTSRFDGLAY
jgi:hypothetical protein